MFNLSSQFFLIIASISVFGLFLIGILIYLIFFLRLSEKEEGKYIYLKTSKEFSQQLEKLMEEELKKVVVDLNRKAQLVSEKMINSYEKEISSFFQGINGEFNQISKVNREIQNRLSKEAEKKMAEFDGSYLQAQNILFQEAKKKTVELGNNISEKVAQIYHLMEESLKEKNIQIEKDIESYKKEKLDKLDREIYLVIGEVAKKTIGKTINLSTHEKLVMEALEKAEKEVIFNSYE